MKSHAENFEKLAFAWCKIATVLLVLWLLRLSPWALPIAALATAALFVLAFALGARESRCILKKPLLIAAFWLAVAALWWRMHSPPL